MSLVVIHQMPFEPLYPQKLIQIIDHPKVFLHQFQYMVHYLAIVFVPPHIEIPLDTTGVYGNCHIHNGITFPAYFIYFYNYCIKFTIRFYNQKNTNY